MSGALSNIYNNLGIALRLHAEAMARLQEQVSTGSRINRPSDDPSAAYRVLGLNTEQRLLENYMKSISQTSGTLETSRDIVKDIASIFSQEKASLTQIVSGSYSQEGRERLAEGVNDKLEQLLSLANTKYMGQYIFGGSNTSSAPYVAQRTDGKITSVSYVGSLDNRKVELAPDLEVSAVYAGDDIFRSNSRSTPVFIGDTGAAAGTGTSSVRGDVWLTVRDNGGYELSIDGGTTWTAAAGANTAVTNSSGEVLYVDTTGITSTGKDMVRVPGTYDIFNVLINIRDLLSNEQSISTDRIPDLLIKSMESIDELENRLVQKSVSIGSQIGFLEGVKNTLDNIKFNTEDETANLQQADITQVAIDLSRREVLYQMSLSVAGRLISMSLLDFIQ